jgi:hypothetical protein
MTCFNRKCTCTPEAKTLFYRLSNLLVSMSIVHKKGSTWDEKKVLECKDWIFYLSVTINNIIKISVFLLFINTHFPYLSNSNIAVRLNIETNKLDHYHIYIYLFIGCRYPPLASNTYSLVLLLLLPSRISQFSWQTRYNYHSWHTHTYSFRARTTMCFFLA